MFVIFLGGAFALCRQMSICSLSQFIEESTPYYYDSL